MKTSNFLLGFAAVLVATISTFASLTQTPKHFVQIRYVGDTNFTCSTVPQCNNLTTTPCRTTVNGIQASIFRTRVNQTTCSTIATTNQVVLPVIKDDDVAEAILQ